MGSGALVVEEGQIEGCRSKGEAGEKICGETHSVDTKCRLD